MRENYTLTRLYIETRLQAGARIDIPKDQIHYLLNVLRMSEGSSLRVFNSQDGEWQAEIAHISKRAGQLTVIKQLRLPAPVPDIWLCFAPIRKHRNAFILEKATELGAARLQPVVTHHTQFAKMKLGKMRAQIIEAAEQTERLCLPDLRDPLTLAELIEQWETTRTLFMADEGGDCPPALEAFQNSDGPAAILIGPEGGFSSQERDLLRGQPFVRPVSLGPRILRADTAALSMLTLWQAVKGDWR